LPKHIYLTDKQTLSQPPPPADGEPHLVLVFDKKTGGMVIKNSTSLVGVPVCEPLGLLKATKLSSAILRLMTLGPLLASLYSLHLSEPKGMQPIKVSMKPAARLFLSEKEKRQVERCFPGSTIVDTLVPKGKSILFYGWFAPNTDPERVGTPYLAPAFGNLGSLVGWKIRRVGITHTEKTTIGYVDTAAHNDEFAAWNDPDGIQRLADACSECDVDYAETLTMLENPEAYAADTKMFALQKLYSDAREDFSRPKDSIKPVVVSQLIDQTCPRSGSLRPTITDVDLIPYSWAVLPHRSKPIYVGLYFVFRPDALAEEVSEVLRVIDQRLQEMSLGILREGSDGTFWVLKNEELILRHRQACGLPPDFVFSDWVRS